ncbi:hypothetical protein L916_20397 [Phytophthora nicotianae]|uniref:Uncharacterized protein n=1 Tax=Phytophthora nicotianae TaxID=4792 RepID=W2HV47_PHYNI|nr:hypothetical protein L916_20397 [Phytophthora nicotianae]
MLCWRRCADLLEQIQIHDRGAWRISALASLCPRQPITAAPTSSKYTLEAYDLDFQLLQVSDSLESCGLELHELE